MTIAHLEECQQALKMVGNVGTYQFEGVPVLDAGVESHENAFGNKTDSTIVCQRLDCIHEYANYSLDQPRDTHKQR